MKKNIKEVCLVCVGIILAFIFVYFIFRAKDEIFEYDTLSNESVYFYVDDIYNEFDSNIKLDSNNNVTSLEIDNKVWNSLIEPIYYSDLDKVIFPTNMSIVKPLVGFKQNKVPFYTNVIVNDGLVSLKNKDLSLDVSNAFFFNGYDLYFFSDNITLKFNDKELSLSPLSYVKCDYKNYLYVFDYKTKSMNKFDEVKSDVLAISDDYSINLGTDTLFVGDKSVILSHSIDKLSIVK